jgi:hypothetical protein
VGCILGLCFNPGGDPFAEPLEKGISRSRYPFKPVVLRKLMASGEA